MPANFVHIDPAIERACATSLVLTTTERLRRNLLLSYNDFQQRQGRLAWTTPRAMTLDGYLAALYGRLRSRQPELPTLLSPEAEYQVFYTTAPKHAERLVSLAQQAWQICQIWLIDIDSANFSTTENGRLFLDWAERIERRLESENIITRAQLPAVSGLKADEPTLSCLAFEHLPRASGDWLERQRAAGVRVETVQVVDQASCGASATAVRTAFDDPTSELAAAAWWARELLSQEGETPSIGIVVPDLASRYTAVLRQFTAELDPGLEHGTGGLVDVGGGSALVDQPVWQVARQWLLLCYDRIPSESARTLFSTRYLDLPDVDALPVTAPPFVNLAQLCAELRLDALSEHLANLEPPERHPPSVWFAAFLRNLQSIGWNGSHTGSVQYQAFAEVRRRLANLARSNNPRPLTPAAALELLDGFLGTVTFAPERPPAAVQVMGYLETTGLTFSHLWVVGMDDQSWPQPVHPNPFLPARLRLQHEVARTSPEQETVFARERLAAWQRSSNYLIVSHAQHSGEAALRPSPLIRGISEADQNSFQPGPAHPYFVHRPGWLETVRDTHGQPLDAGTHRGGTGRIRDQAICPFRGYAIHRLGLKEERLPHGLPDALDRGVLIHEALHLLYQAAVDRQTSADTLEAADFANAADQALERHYGRFPRPFRLRERERLIALLDTWNTLESSRGSLDIEALELDMTAEFDGIGLRLRVDRMDRIGDALLVIDYKTGRIGSRLSDDRLVEPQLPVYALCNDRVEGVLYAEVNDTRPRFKGISSLEVPGAALQAPSGGSWERQRLRWREQLADLTGEIRDGAAAVMPHTPRVCQTCHLKSLCRIALDEVDPEEIDA